MTTANADNVTLQRPRGTADLLLCLAVVVPLAAGVVAFSSLSVTWFVLLSLGLGGVAAILWSKDIERSLAFGFAATLPVELTKALITTNSEVYTPPLHLTLSDLALLPLLLLWVGQRKLVEKRGFRLSPFHFPALCFVAWHWFSLLHTPQLKGGICAAIIATKYFLIFMWAADYVDSTRRLRNLLLGAAGGLTLNLLFTVVQFLTGSRLEMQGAKAATVGTSLVFAQGGGLHTLRPFGFLQHPNVLASYLVLVLPILLVFVLGRKRPAAPTWCLMTGFFTVSLGCLLLTLSRGGWVACFVAFVVVFGLGVRRRLVTVAAVVMVAVSLVAGALAAGIVYPALYLRLTDSDERAGESRILMAEQAFLISREKPLTGIGLGGYNTLARARIPASFSRVPTDYQKELRKAVVHNKYLLVLAELGAVGLGLFLYLLYRAVRVFFMVPRWRDGFDHGLGLGLLAGIIGQLAFFHFDHFYVDVRNGLLWFAFGVLSGLVRLQAPAAMAAAPRRAA